MPEWGYRSLGQGTLFCPEKIRQNNSCLIVVKLIDRAVWAMYKCNGWSQIVMSICCNNLAVHPYTYYWLYLNMYSHVRNTKCLLALCIPTNK